MEKFNSILILFIIVLPLIAQIYVSLSYNKYSKINNSSSLTGKDIAQRILEMNGVRDVTIGPINGKLSDHYNPKNKTILLSSEVYDKTSIAAASVAAHEVGHALQDKEGYGFLKLRTALVPIVNFTSRTATFIILLGFILEAINLVNLGILFLGIGLLFQLITLPVEFNASARAKRELARCGVVSTEDQTGTSSVLKAAALTYVAVFFATALQILRLIIISRDRN